MTGGAAGIAISENERLRRANDALGARMERHLTKDAALAREPQAEAPGWTRRHVEMALDASGVATALFTDDGRLVAVGGAFARLLPDARAGLSPGLRFEEAMRAIASSKELDLPGAVARRLWAEARIAARGQPCAPCVTPLTGDRWIEISERPIAYGGFALAFEDVTSAVHGRRRERGAPSADSGAVLRSALDHLALGIAAFDRDGRLVACNESLRAQLGLGLDELREGAPYAELARRIVAGRLIAPTEGARRVALWVESAPPRAPLSVDLTRADGAVLDARFRETAGGGFVLSLDDVTAERRAGDETRQIRETLEKRVSERTAALVEVNDKLVQEIAERRAIETEMRHARDAAEAANLSKTRFLAAASHDLLQPLNAAKLFVSALTASALPEPEAGIARRVESAFSSVEALLNALLDISKLDAGGGETVIADFPVARILGPIAEEFRPIAAERGLRFEVVPSRAVIRSDPHYLRRIVQNLIANALKYTVEGGVVVGCRPRGNALRIEVWDSGVGIPAAERRRIFEEFHRIDAANPRAERGMGLGLAIVDRASRLLGHGVDIRSGEGAGSMFAVTAPRGDPARVAEPQAAIEALDFADGEAGMIALVVDDDPAVRAATAALLGRWGIDALEAASGDEAMAAAGQLGMAPDVVLLDYHLSGGETGLEALARLRAAFGADLRAILITADRSHAVALAAERAGAQLLTKPVAPAKLRSLLHWSRSERQSATS